RFSGMNANFVSSSKKCSIIFKNMLIRRLRLTSTKMLSGIHRETSIWRYVWDQKDRSNYPTDCAIYGQGLDSLLRSGKNKFICVVCSTKFSQESRFSNPA